jgi:hypothetical protein
MNKLLHPRISVTERTIWWSLITIRHEWWIPKTAPPGALDLLFIENSNNAKKVTGITD